MQRIVPCLWFDANAEEAVAFYTSTFDRGRVGSTLYRDEANARLSGLAPGSVLTIDFEIEGRSFTALNGGPAFRPNPSISFYVACPTEAEVDALWAALADGGMALMPLGAYPFSAKFGWVQDRFGISWQLALDDKRRERWLAPFLMFINENAGNAEDAMRHYVATFPDAEISRIERYGPDQDAAPPEMISTAEFTLLGQALLASENTYQHEFGFNEAVSLQVMCDTQEQIDAYWEALSAIPEAENCGWVKDRWGVSWQIVPTRLLELLQGTDRAGAQRTMEAMLEMRKLDIAALEAAYEGRD